MQQLLTEIVTDVVCSSKFTVCRAPLWLVPASDGIHPQSILSAAVSKGNSPPDFCRLKLNEFAGRPGGVRAHPHEHVERRLCWNPGEAFAE
jgi:hypothetical protein